MYSSAQQYTNTTSGPVNPLPIAAIVPLWRPFLSFTVHGTPVFTSCLGGSMTLVIWMGVTAFSSGQNTTTKLSEEGS